MENTTLSFSVYTCRYILEIELHAHMLQLIKFAVRLPSLDNTQFQVLHSHSMHNHKFCPQMLFHSQCNVIPNTSNSEHAQQHMIHDSDWT